MTSDWPSGLAKAWHPIAYGDELGSKPLAVRLLGRPLVLFRGATGPALLEDRCPHRNAPLSAGRVVGGLVECPYHGWRFDAAGQCRSIAGSHENTNCAAAAFRVVERDGLVWANLAGEEGPPPALPSEAGDPAYDRFWWRIPASRGTIGDAIENLLDPMHSYFLHPGLVRRSREPTPVEIEFSSTAEGVRARYTESRDGMTLLQKLTEGARVASWGIYRAPTQVQIAFEDSKGIHAAISVVFSPLSKYETRPYACFSTRCGWLPAAFKRAAIIAFHRRVLSQDLAMLALQADRQEEFGGPSYHNGPLDIFGRAIWAAFNERPIAEEKRSLSIGSQG